MARPCTPGDGLLRPLALLALAGLLLNDHVFKALGAGTSWSLLTGKLSDVCGLLFLPVLLVAGSEMFASWRGRFDRPSPRVAIVVAFVVALSFTLMKTVPACGAVYVDVLSLLQWPFFALGALVKDGPLPGLQPPAHVIDPTDVGAVPFAFYVVLQTRQRASELGRHAKDGQERQ